MVDIGSIIQAGVDTGTAIGNWVGQYKTMEKQIELANTAHYREIMDLKKAGLNPALSVAGGHGAVTPSLQAPQLQKVDYQGILNRLQDRKVQEATEKNIQELTKTQGTQQNFNNAAAAREYSQSDLNRALRLKAMKEADATTAMTASYKLDAALKAVDLITQEAHKKIYEGIPGKILPYLEWLRQFVPFTTSNQNYNVPKGQK